MFNDKTSKNNITDCMHQRHSSSNFLSEAKLTAEFDMKLYAQKDKAFRTNDSRNLKRINESDSKENCPERPKRLL